MINVMKIMYDDNVYNINSKRNFKVSVARVAQRQISNTVLICYLEVVGSIPAPVLVFQLLQH